MLSALRLPVSSRRGSGRTHGYGLGVERGVCPAFEAVPTATDPDDGDSVPFALNDGSDETKFAITLSVVLVLLTAPDHEQPPTPAGTTATR